MPMEPVSVTVHLLRFSELPEPLKERFLKGGEPLAEYRGKLFLRQGDRVLCCERSPAGKELLAAFPADSTPQSAKKAEDPWQAVLRGDYTGQGGIRDGIRRQVIVFAAVPGDGNPLRRDQLEPLIPLQKGDALTAAGSGIVAMIRGCGENGEEDNAEFAAAVTETVLGETGVQICAGIGNPADSLNGLPESLAQAEEAVRTGFKHPREGYVFVYRRQTLERLIEAVPPQRRAKLKREIITPGARRILTEEMLETIRVYFRNDLNLSTTARQLFIHRNTLNYRLEKIRRETGLDLRNFRDAAVFQLISLLPDNPEQEE